MQVLIRDETTAGDSLYELALEFLTERITVRDLIRERVYHEVRRFNRRENEVIFHGLVQPTQAEQALNRGKIEYRMKHHRPIDLEEQFARALDGFSKNSFFILIDDKQAASLDQEFTINPATHVSFVKLIPLVGG